MNIWARYPFLRYSIFLIAGIITYKNYPEFLGDSSWWIFLFPIICTPFLFFRSIKIRYIVRGCILLYVIFITGIAVANWHSEEDINTHYHNKSGIKSYQIRIDSDHTERTDYLRYEAQVLKLFTDSAIVATGKILLYIRKDSAIMELEYGDILNVHGGIYQVPSPQNPYEFDYRAYLGDQNIFGHSFISANDITKVDNRPSNFIFAFSYKIRNWSRRVIIENISWKREQAVILALIIGIKDNLDNELKASYSSAGAMHVLAVSGLHVGIVYQMIIILFSFLKRVKYGTIAFILISLLAIWLYALVTGFTPSVLRASIMFSIILLSEHTGRKSNIYNSLGIAAFILLLIDPNNIYSVGFRLSFIAVFGIVFFHPILYRQLYFSSKLPAYLWSITCVSLAAQAATFPLTIFYFHQFPTYFLISNLLVIPAAMVMLVLGLCMLISSAILPFVAYYIGLVLTWIVWGLNESIYLLQSLPKPIIDWLYFDSLDTVLVYGVLLFIALGLSQGNFQKLTLGLLLLLILNLKWAIDNWRIVDQERLVFYEIKSRVALDVIQGIKSKLYIDQWSQKGAERIGFQINPNRLASRLSPVEENWNMIDSAKQFKSTDLGKLFIWNDETILFYDPKENIVIKDTLEVDVVYLNKIVLLDKRISPSIILLGSDLKSWYQQKLVKQYPNIQVHSLSEDGYYESQR
ncbi:MAG: competence protein ComEC [Cyclobacteriaceae bacterium]|jgi:competence protein ComEC